VGGGAMSFERCTCTLVTDMHGVARGLTPCRAHAASMGSSGAGVMAAALINAAEAKLATLIGAQRASLIRGAATAKAPAHLGPNSEQIRAALVAAYERVMVGLDPEEEPPPICTNCAAPCVEVFKVDQSGEEKKRWGCAYCEQVEETAPGRWETKRGARAVRRRRRQLLAGEEVSVDRVSHVDRAARREQEKGSR
jgi:hypothetical protein